MTKSLKSICNDVTPLDLAVVVAGHAGSARALDLADVSVETASVGLDDVPPRTSATH